jgi:CRP-like cAMP-binding protein
VDAIHSAQQRGLATSGRSDQGRDAVFHDRQIDVLQRGFGCIGLADESRSADAVATCPSLVAQLPKQEALKLLTEYPVVAKRMMEHLASLIKQQNQHLYMLNQPSAVDRIKALLLIKAKRYASGLMVVESLPSQSQLAKMANTSRETVSRTLSKLIREGVIEKDYKRLIIRQPNALQPKEE